MNIHNRFFIYFFSLITLSVVLGWVFTQWQMYQQLGQIGLIIAFIAGFSVLFELIRQDFLKPILELQVLVGQYKSDQNHQFNPRHNSLKAIPKAIAHLVLESEQLYKEMDDVLQAQIKRLSKKSSLLETLYAISSSLNEITDSDKLLSYFLQVFINMTQANSGVIRMFDDNQLLLNIASIKGNLDDKEQIISIPCEQCVCGKIARDAQNNVQFSVHTCAKCIGQTSEQKCHYGTIFIPLVHQGQSLGIVNLFFDKTPSLSQDERALLKTIGEHLAIAIDKAKIDANARRLSLSQERLYLSQDIHDSLSQILYSVGLQTSALLDIIQKSTKDEAFAKASDIQSSINQANTELRQLLNNFRKPLEYEHNDLLSRIKTLANTMQENTLSIYVHCIDNMKLAPEIENQILSIIQEVLTNAKKHANASNIRILLSKDSVMIEDDGIGFKVVKNKDSTKEGFHLGLTILKERAMRIHAQLSIESELGEGTQVILQLDKK